MRSNIQNKIVIAIPVLLTGGTEIQTLNLVKVLKNADFEVIVLCYYEYEQDMVVNMEEAGATVILLELKRDDGLLSLLKKLIVQFKQIAPAIVHVQYVAPGLIPIIAARLARVQKLIATVHQPGRTYGWKAKQMLRFGAKLCNIFLCVSKSAEESWFGDSAFFEPELFNQGRKHFTIYNAVDTEQITKESCSKNGVILRTSLNLDGKKVVGYVGRLRWEKGTHILIAAFAKVVRKIPEAALLVVGDGSDREDLEKQANELGIGESIIWLGQKNQQEVFQLYGLMDVVAMPSFFEGFGLTAAEAMAAGVPVVASDIDGLSEVIDNQQTGILVNVDDPDAMAFGIIDLLNRSEQTIRMSNASQLRVNSLFSIAEFQKKTLAVYQLTLCQ